MRDFEIEDFRIEETINNSNRTYDYKIELFYRLTYIDLVLCPPKYYIQDLFKNIDFKELLIENLTGLS